MAHLYIINPLSGASMDNLFATHPDTENRIAALQRIAGQMQTGSGGPSALPGPWSSAATASDTVRAGWRVPTTGEAADDGHTRGPWG